MLYRLIIAEDELKIREGIAYLFPWKQLGFEVVGQFPDGKKALEFIRQDNDVQIVLTDISMPIIDGIELSSPERDRYSCGLYQQLSGF